MAAGKNIEIKIAASGGDAAAAEIRKVETAGKGLVEQGNVTGFGGMLDQLPEQAQAAGAGVEDLNAKVDDLVEKMGRVTQETADAGEAMETAGEKADKLDKAGNEDRSVRRKLEIVSAVGAIGAAAASAGKAIGNVYEQLSKIDTVELRKLDEGFADQIDRAKAFAEALEDPIAAMVRLANGGESLKDAVGTLNEQLSLNAEQRADHIDRMIATGIVQVEEIKKLANDLKAASDLLDAKDRVDAVKRDGADAAAVRGGANPDDVRASRANFDAEKKIEAIDRDINGKNTQAQTAADNAKQARLNAEDLATSGKASPDEITKARDAAAALGKEAERLLGVARQAAALGTQKRLEVRGVEENTVSDAAGDKAAKAKAATDKLGAEAARVAQQQQQAAARASAAQLQADRKAAADALRENARANAGTLGNNPRTNSTRNKAGASALKDLGKDIGSADTDAEIKAARDKIVASQGVLGASLVSAMNQMLAGQEALLKKVQVLEGRIKNSNPR